MAVGDMQLDPRTEEILSTNGYYMQAQKQVCNASCYPVEVRMASQQTAHCLEQ
jgi:hypothetical protein